MTKSLETLISEESRDLNLYNYTFIYSDLPNNFP